MENEGDFFKKNNEITTVPNHLYYEFEKYGKKEFLSFLSNKLQKNFNIIETEELINEDKTFNRKTYSVVLVLENLTENKKLIVEGGSNNYENDGGMPHGFQVTHSDFSQTEIDEMLDEFKDTYYKWTEQQ